MRKYLIALAATAAFAAPASAATVFSDNFDTENGGFSAFNYAGFANFSVTGNVDIIQHGTFFNCPGPGLCVDLDGTSGPGELLSLASFAFNAGDVVRLSYDLSGNQRGAADDGWYSGFSFGAATQINNYGFNYFGSDTIVGDFNTSSISTSTNIASGDPFAARSIFFTAGNAGTLNFYIGTNSADNFGPVLDNVGLDIGPGAVPEPTTWAMMIAGFGLVGGAMRRTKGRQRTRAKIAFA